MRVYNKFGTGHKDLVQDVSYDYYGKRLATCSLDGTIKVWDLDDQSKWIESAVVRHPVGSSPIRQHTGAVWKVAWAHPEFGQHVMFLRRHLTFVLKVIATCSYDRTVCIFEENAPGSWALKATLLEALSGMVDVKFAPKHMGLKLATASMDGSVRIYEAIDVMNLAHWPLMEEFEVSKAGCSCVAWNPSPFGRPMIAVGTCDREKNIQLHEYNETFRRWQLIKTLSEHRDQVLDVCWAHPMGRTFHQIASTAKDHSLLVWTLKGGDGEKELEASCENLTSQQNMSCDTWRVQFNITGTMLLSAADDGVVRLWKQDFGGSWRSISNIDLENS